MSDTLLIIEDEALLGREMQRRFVKQGWDVVLSTTIEDARAQFVDRHLRPLVILADMNLPDGNSLDLIDELTNSASITGEWILLTAYGSIPDSVRALQLGAQDFIEKPADDARLDMAVQRAARSAKAQRRLTFASASQAAKYSVEHFIGRSNSRYDLIYKSAVIKGQIFFRNTAAALSPSNALNKFKNRLNIGFC